MVTAIGVLGFALILIGFLGRAGVGERKVISAATFAAGALCCFIDLALALGVIDSAFGLTVAR